MLNLYQGPKFLEAYEENDGKNTFVIESKLLKKWAVTVVLHRQ